MGRRRSPSHWMWGREPKVSSWLLSMPVNNLSHLMVDSPVGCPPGPSSWTPEFAKQDGCSGGCGCGGTDQISCMKVVRNCKSGRDYT